MESDATIMRHIPKTKENNMQPKLQEQKRVLARLLKVGTIFKAFVGSDFTYWIVAGKEKDCIHAIRLPGGGFDYTARWISVGRISPWYTGKVEKLTLEQWRQVQPS